MAEYSIGLEPQIKVKLDLLMDRVGNIKSVKKMNKMLYQCKELVMSLRFFDSDLHHRYLKEQLIKFGIQNNQLE